MILNIDEIRLATIALNTHIDCVSKCGFEFEECPSTTEYQKLKIKMEEYMEGCPSGLRKRS